jgi:hypothetical protein
MFLQMKALILPMQRYITRPSCSEGVFQSLISSLWQQKPFLPSFLPSFSFSDWVDAASAVNASYLCLRELRVVREPMPGQDG